MASELGVKSSSSSPWLQILLNNTSSPPHEITLNTTTGVGGGDDKNGGVSVWNKPSEASLTREELPFSSWPTLSHSSTVLPKSSKPPPPPPLQVPVIASSPNNHLRRKRTTASKAPTTDNKKPDTHHPSHKNNDNNNNLQQPRGVGVGVGNNNTRPPASRMRPNGSGSGSWTPPPRPIVLPHNSHNFYMTPPPPPPQRLPTGFIPPLPTAAANGHFVTPMPFHDMPPPLYYVNAMPPQDSLRTPPFVPAPLLLHPQLRPMIARQVDYYFSNENLCRDVYLREHMDEKGWVPISVIANFNRVKQLTNDIQLILDVVRASTVVELQGDKLRRRTDWKTWVLVPSNPSSSSPNPESLSVANHDMLAKSIESIGLRGGLTTTDHDRTVSDNTHIVAVLSRSSSGELNGSEASRTPYSSNVGEAGRTSSQESNSSSHLSNGYLGTSDQSFQESLSLATSC
ncbi:hypothetical protein GIB67_040819 [Kingdonia uniflora]|uniref:HTH La-type RNA-binding domain-containing protein n=1 Tax=Kingdonia uniflora TaxID=39325 RepID=A0A7J7P4E6_9MAGN|nr:hypothetical protein GIB67_040819 [Kingdonia uniflora]